MVKIKLPVVKLASELGIVGLDHVEDAGVERGAAGGEGWSEQQFASSVHVPGPAQWASSVHSAPGGSGSAVGLPGMQCFPGPAPFVQLADRFRCSPGGCPGWVTCPALGLEEAGGAVGDLRCRTVTELPPPM